MQVQWPTSSIMSSLVSAIRFRIETEDCELICAACHVVFRTLPAYTQQLALIGNRRVPSTRDFYAALAFSGARLRPDELTQFVSGRTARPSSWTIENESQKDLPDWCDPLRDCLPSESEDDSAQEDQDAKSISTTIGTRSKAASSIPQRKRRRKRFRPEMSEVPGHLPSLPPKHTWLATPSYSAHSISLQPPLAFLDLKVSSNRLMEASLRGLIRATDTAQLDSQSKRKMPESQDDSSRAQNPAPITTGEVVEMTERPEINPQSSVFAKPAVPAFPSNPEVKDEDGGARSHLKKGRTLSLRLRTPSISNTAVPTSAESSDQPQSASPAPAAKRPFSHRPSMSLLGSQSAIATSFAPHIRRNTMAAAAPWSTTSTSSTFNWNAPAMPGTAFSPLNTPLTPGLTFQYPATPINEDIAQMTDADASVATLALPPTINYKRTWYKKSNSAQHTNQQQQQRLVQL